ncbi:hypothetical protein MLD38_026886 [Melastoma candidum]|uniref:Uncharacterized protein n=1 Tax=Melastoma candidum TaxID=119954 RepID=A0ACB9P0X1_9MYRT|nr:hypothetical protein MLD38_026886 [Melastoma candidum]
MDTHQLVLPDFSKRCVPIPRKAALREPNGRLWREGMIENVRESFVRSGCRSCAGQCPQDSERVTAVKMEMEEEEETMKVEEVEALRSENGSTFVFDRSRKPRGRSNSIFDNKYSKATASAPHVQSEGIVLLSTRYVYPFPKTSATKWTESGCWSRHKDPRPAVLVSWVARIPEGQWDAGEPAVGGGIRH